MGAILSRVNRSETYAGYTDLEVMACPICGVTYAAPKRLLDYARKHPDQEWFCPNGHNLHFPGKTEEQKLREERDRRARVQSQLDQAEASLRATKGVVTKQRKQLDRVAKGVCPCCNRSFADVRKHMQTKHPEFVPAKASK